MAQSWVKTKHGRINAFFHSLHVWREYSSSPWELHTSAFTIQQAECNKETARNTSRVLNINNIYAIGRIKGNLEPDGIYIDRRNPCSLHRRACCKQACSGAYFSASEY